MGNCLDTESEERKDLLFALNRDDNKLIRRLLKRGSDPNKVYYSTGWTPLHIAAYRSNERGVALLLKYGADPQIKDMDGKTPLIEAQIRGFKSVVKVLKDHSRNLSTTNNVKSPNKISDKPAAQDCQFRNASPGVKANAQARTLANPLAGTLTHAIGCAVVAEALANPPPNSIFGIVAEALANPPPNSIFGIVADAEAKQFGRSFSGPASANRVKIFVSCPFQGDRHGSLMFLPDSFEELIKIGVEKYDFLAGKITTREGVIIEDISLIREGDHVVLARDRIVVSCPQKGDHDGRLQWMPKSLEELIDIGVDKYGFLASKVTTKEGVRIENVSDIKDGDHVILARDRIVVSCPQKRDHHGRLVWLPESLEDLINMGVDKYGFLASKVTTREGAKIEDISHIKDGDHVILALE